VRIDGGCHCGRITYEADLAAVKQHAKQSS
jgi:hypothetical protein